MGKCPPQAGNYLYWVEKRFEFGIGVVLFYVVMRTAMDANQYNANLIINAISKLHSAARSAMVTDIDGLEKDSNKRSCGPQISDANKIESLYCTCQSTASMQYFILSTTHGNTWYLQPIEATQISHFPLMYAKLYVF